MLHDTKVNSYHNHSVTKKNLSEQLIPIAETEDGSIECAIHISKNILGVQWHPERQKNVIDRELIDLFLKDEL